MRTRLPQYYVVHTHESALLWRENHHSSTGFSKNSIDTETSYQMLEVFIIILRSGEVFTSINKHNSANFSGKKKKENWLRVYAF